MREYEGIFVTKTGTTEEQTQKLLDQILSEISKNGGKVDNTEKWGKRNLAYPINKNKEGVYFKLDFKIEPEKISELKKTYRLNEDILRVMIVKKPFDKLRASS